MNIPIIFDIQRLCVHDGPGIRTTVFIKGCNLSCKWCHNPESLDKSYQILYDNSKCISCKDCISFCKNGAHIFDKTTHILKRSNCTLCFECTSNCVTGALSVCGKKYNTQELTDIILKDKDFYGSDGGVTFSGGEALNYPDFIAQVMKKCKENGITTAIDTSGFVPFSAFEKTLPYTDTYLYDIKLADSALHEQWTGVDNTLILSNLKKLDDMGANIFIRIPVIGGVNDNTDEMEKIAKNIVTLKSATKITLIPYNSLGKKKYSMLSKDYYMDDTAKVSTEKLNELRNIFVELKLNVDKI